jgi:hypothetical protein
VFGKGLTMQEVCMKLGLSFLKMDDNMDTLVVNDNTLSELCTVLQRSVRRYGSPLRNEATTRHIEEVLAYFMDPYLDDVKLELQEPMNGTMAISSRNSGVKALAAVLNTTMAEGIPQCISQLYAMHEQNMQCGYKIETYWGIASNLSQFGIIRYTTSKRQIEVFKASPVWFLVLNEGEQITQDVLKRTPTFANVLGILNHIMKDVNQTLKNVIPDQKLISKQIAYFLEVGKVLLFSIFTLS